VIRRNLAVNGGAHEALLVPAADGWFDILVDPDRTQTVRSERTSEHRLRFRVAHEIAHSFFYDRSVLPATRATRPSDREEGFCNSFATALLLPPAIGLRWTGEPQDIFVLRRRYGVSADVVARALAMAHPELTIVGLSRMTKPDGSGEADLRVLWSHSRFVPTVARLGSDAAREAETRGSAKGVEVLTVGPMRGVFEVAAASSQGGQLTIAVLREQEVAYKSGESEHAGET
jgi:hypothetical protein